MSSAERPIVIGSGPSGVAVAAALIEAGQRPAILDGGFRPEPAAFQRLQRVGSSLAGERQPRSEYERTNPGQKTWFGSNSAFAQSPFSPLVYESGVVARASYGVGGLSRVWGGTFAFARGLGEWPEQCRPSQEDYELVRSLVPASTTVWSSAAVQAGNGEVEGAPASQVAMQRFVRSNPGAWVVEPSRVAIDSDKSSSSACIGCGLCLSGCPTGSIWYSGEQVDAWRRSGAIDYQPGRIAVHVQEDGDEVRVTVEGSDGRTIVNGTRVFLAGGAISTGALVLASGFRDHLDIRDTATAFLAAVSFRHEPNMRAGHALSQWWLRSLDSRFSAQVYAPNPEHAQRLAARLPARVAPVRVLERVALRLHPVIAYLDPSLSDPMRLTLAGDKVVVSGQRGPSSERIFRAYLKDLARGLRRAGYLVPIFATEFTPPGTGYHFGASLPHGTATDSVGCLPGTSRIHIADSSVLPRIEVGSITPTVMANAARVARTVAQMRAAT